MIRNDLMFYESIVVFCFGYNFMVREYLYLKFFRNLDIFIVYLYIGNRKISFFYKYFKFINIWFCFMKKCM